MSNTTCVDAEDVAPMNTADRLPSASSRTVTLLARTSPVGKLSVDDEGLDVRVGPRNRNPAEVCPVTVRLPVTAVASPGTGPQPVMQKVRGTRLVNRPASPSGARVSRNRVGAIA